MFSRLLFLRVGEKREEEDVFITNFSFRSSFSLLLGDVSSPRDYTRALLAPYITIEPLSFEEEEMT